MIRRLAQAAITQDISAARSRAAPSLHNRPCPSSSWNLFSMTGPRRTSSRVASAASANGKDTTKAPEAVTSPPKKVTAKPKRKSTATDETSVSAKADEADKLASPSLDTAPDKPPPKKTKRKSTAGGDPDSPAAPTGNDTLAFEGCPKNVDIPKDLAFTDAPRPQSSIRLASWNIVSLKSAEPKGLNRYLDGEDADIVVLTETKVNEIPSFFQSAKYPHQTWGIGATKSYAGVALLSKIKPLSVQKGLPMLEDYDSKGRCITVEFGNCFVVGTYCVNAGEGLRSMEQKKNWNRALALHISDLDAKKPVIWTGDLNVVLDERDLAKASAKWNKSAGYTQIECDHHRDFLDAKIETRPDAKPFKDIWRELHPDAVGHFSYYGWRGQCRIKGIGWRIDSFIISERIKSQCSKCEIRHEVYGASDHVPIFADFDRSLF